MEAGELFFQIVSGFLYLCVTGPLWRWPQALWALVEPGLGKDKLYGVAVWGAPTLAAMLPVRSASSRASSQVTIASSWRPICARLWAL